MPVDPNRGALTSQEDDGDDDGEREAVDDERLVVAGTDVGEQQPYGEEPGDRSRGHTQEDGTAVAALVEELGDLVEGRAGGGGRGQEGAGAGGRLAGGPAGEGAAGRGARAR